MSAGLTADQVEYLNSRSTGKKKVVTEQLSVQEEDRRRRLWRWHLLYPYFPFIRQHCDTLYASLLCMKSASFKMAYSSIGEFFYKLGLSNFSIRRYFPSSDFFFQVGKVRQAYENFKEKYLKEFNGIFDKLKAYLEVGWVGLFVLYENIDYLLLLSLLHNPFFIGNVGRVKRKRSTCGVLSN